ncbi:MAG: hypothetical protein GWO20_02790 [Candidatus Korarchaeota archaeon]|nr:hypothetical protein [Candidatus Korarchaeota archaeon]NIU82399.1 hypothetical protein [Candidatus Thorarchaeota archaeon]NIW12872.1 hypothetical protein [Candidatus Thorarchaeota archaeon]NIW51066.1 hypothetical protein [Candidatus Korarchaeota archaeon]
MIIVAVVAVAIYVFLKKGKKKGRGKRVQIEDIQSRIRGLKERYEQGTINEDMYR